MEYITRKRMKAVGICGEVNIPWGTVLVSDGEFILHNGLRLCAEKSQNAYDYCSCNDDGKGKDRGNLVGRILAKLEKRDAGYQSRWNKIWADPRCQKYKRPEHEDHWLWNHDFYHAPVEDLRYITAMIGA